MQGNGATEGSSGVSPIPGGFNSTETAHAAAQAGMLGIKETGEIRTIPGVDFVPSPASLTNTEASTQQPIATGPDQNLVNGLVTELQQQMNADKAVIAENLAPTQPDSKDATATNEAPASESTAQPPTENAETSKGNHITAEDIYEQFQEAVRSNDIPCFNVEKGTSVLPVAIDCKDSPSGKAMILFTTNASGLHEVFHVDPGINNPGIENNIEELIRSKAKTFQEQIAADHAKNTPQQFSEGVKEIPTLGKTLIISGHKGEPRLLNMVPLTDTEIVKQAIEKSKTYAVEYKTQQADRIKLSELLKSYSK